MQRKSTQEKKIPHNNWTCNKNTEVLCLNVIWGISPCSSGSAAVLVRTGVQQGPRATPGAGGGTAGPGQQIWAGTLCFSHPEVTGFAVVEIYFEIQV